MSYNFRECNAGEEREGKIPRINSVNTPAYVKKAGALEDCYVVGGGVGGQFASQLNN